MVGVTVSCEVQLTKAVARTPLVKLRTGSAVDNYSSEIIAAMIAAVSVLSGAAMTHWLSQRQQRGQQQWDARERHYMELLRHLTKARLNLSEQSEYFDEPGSEYHDHSKNERFVRLGKAAHESLAALEELTGPARVFLSPKSISALEEMRRGTWHASMGASHIGEYIAAAVKLVEKAEAEVLAAAKTHLN
jgi:hypothetical protein